MTPFVRLAGGLIFSLSCLAVHAATLELIPGSAPQSTRLYAFFPNPIGVILRDDNGAPIQGAEVEVVPDSFDMPRIAFYYDFFLGTPKTNANGVLIFQGPVAVGPGIGVARLTANSSGASIALPPLTILPGPAARVIALGGGGQRVDATETFPAPWRVQAIDADGHGVPFALVEFDSSIGVPGPKVRFNGFLLWGVMADSDGNATSPLPVAGNVGGSGIGHGCAVQTPCVEFPFEILAWHTVLVSAPPPSIEVGATAIAPYVVKVTGSSGQGIAGALVRFETDPACGSFDGFESADRLTDASGAAVSALFVGILPGVVCATNAAVTSVSPQQELDLDMFIFDPDRVHIGGPIFVQSRTRHSFNVTISFTADDTEGQPHPIYGLPVGVRVVSAPHGASATLAATPAAPYTSNAVTLAFNANNDDGVYFIAVTRGAVRHWIAVDQRRR